MQISPIPTLSEEINDIRLRTADIVGLDTLAFVANTAYQKCENDPSRDIFKLPDFLNTMIDNKSLGQKTGAGFYKKIDKGVIHSIDLKTLDYTPMNKKRYRAIALAKERTLLADKLKAIVDSKDSAGEFVWATMSRSLLYSINNLLTIADNVVDVDNALKWGFGWDFGPFEILDAIGVEYFISRLKKEGKSVILKVCTINFK